MKAFGFALLVAVLLIAPVSPATADDAASPTGVRDRLPELVGAWSCRTATDISSRVFVEQPASDTIVLRRETYYRYNTTTERETFHAVPTGGWTVEGQGVMFHGQGPTWTGDSWVVDGTIRPPYQTESRPGQLHFERLGGDTLRMFATDTGPYAVDAALCHRGDAPPDSTACVAPNLAPYTVKAVEPETPVEAMREHIGGTVQVLVTLDPDSHVTDAAIKSSSSVLLNRSALAAARQSIYRTGTRDCKPVPSQYVFTVQYIAG